MSGGQTAEYGSWKSPISSQLATASSVSFQELHVDRAQGQTEKVYWSELRYDEDGRYALCHASAGQPGHQDHIPSDYSSRTLVHEYGGGAFCVYDGTVYFSNFKDQRLYVQRSSGGHPEALTPDGANQRFADAQYSPQHKLLYCVCEDHSGIESGARKEARNTVVVIDPSSHKQHTLASGCDFYASPKVSPDGNRLVWVQWNHPNMPWDSTEIWMADLNPTGEAVVEGSAKKVAGGEDISVVHPSWTRDNELLYIGDQSDWWNLYHVTSTGEHVNLRTVEEEIGRPHWVFANYPYDLDPSGSGDIVTAYAGELGVLNLASKDYRKVDTGFTFHCYIQWAGDGKVYCVAGSPTQFPCVIRVDVSSGKVEVVRESRPVSTDSAYFSVPKKITWPTANNEVSHGYFYAPQNKDFRGPDSSLPPLLVKAHGGPTAYAGCELNLKMQYFTSRGIAVLDVDYRGSTGYGTRYRNRLRDSWGICDVEDCCSGALHLANSKLVDGDKLCIDGGSAGGYTTLACLTFKDVFKAGASHYGIGDLEILAAETHKFESRYVVRLIAPFTPENMKVFHDRSPIKHVDLINCPVAFFQGDEDKIVLPNQAMMMFEAVKAKGLPCAFTLFKGEQHGFRKSENIQKALDGEFYFFSQVLGFEPADKHCKLEIVNLK